MQASTRHLLLEATAQLEVGNAGFHEVLLSAWRECRCAELAELIESLGQRHGGGDVAAEKLKEWQAGWVRIARELNSLNLPGLLESLLRRALPRNASVIASCLDELAPYVDDPLLTVPLLKLLELPAASVAWNKVHTRIFQLLEGAGDPRAIRGLDFAVTRAATPLSEWSEARRASLARAERTQQHLLERFPAGVPAAPSDLTDLMMGITRLNPAKLSSASARPPRTDEQTLLEAIWDEPSDDARRLVYADALQQRGDPRGELIALQMSNHPDSPQKAERIIKKHRTALLGAIAKAVVPSSAVFEKGFLVECTTDIRRKADANVVFGRPEWATVKRITFGRYASLSPTMRALEEARNIPDTELECLGRESYPRLRVLVVKESPSSFRNGEPLSRGLQALATTRGLPALRELSLRFSAGEDRNYSPYIRDASDFAWLLEAPVCAQLEVLAVPGFALWHQADQAGVSLPSWVSVLRKHSSLVRIDMPLDEGTISLEKDGIALRATFSAKPNNLPQNLRKLVEVVRSRLAGTGVFFAH